MSDDRLFGFIKFAVRSPLAEQVVALGVCSACHSKALRFAYSGGGASFYQCKKCKTVQVTEEQPKGGDK